MIICAHKAIQYRDTPVQPKVKLIATHCQAIDYTRCWAKFINIQNCIIIRWQYEKIDIQTTSSFHNPNVTAIIEITVKDKFCQLSHKRIQNFVTQNI
jgi:hypothetical protein